MWLDWLVVCDCSFSLSALWSPHSVPTVLLGFHLPWKRGLSSRLLQQSLAAAPCLRCRVAPLGHHPWPQAQGSSSYLRCCTITAAILVCRLRVNLSNPWLLLALALLLRLPQSLVHFSHTPSPPSRCLPAVSSTLPWWMSLFLHSSAHYLNKLHFLSCVRSLCPTLCKCRISKSSVSGAKKLTRSGRSRDKVVHGNWKGMPVRRDHRWAPAPSNMGDMDSESKSSP